jgi:hypothetical protein
MHLNLGRGFWRLWLFLALVWVSVCFYQVESARYEVRKAHDLERYYTREVSHARLLAGHDDIITPLVSQHLREELAANKKVIEEETVRDQRFTYLAWVVPAIALVFALGIPWVWAGFTN